MTTTADPRSPRVPHRLFDLACLCAAVAAFGGCDGSGETGVPLYPTTGQVLVRGKPMVGAQVMFKPVSNAPIADGKAPPAPVSIAKTDQDGKFRLTTHSGPDGTPADGAPAGDYTVAIATSRQSDSGDILAKKAPGEAANLVGSRYADPRTSGLKATIKAGENTLEPFDLKASGGPKTPLGSGDRAR